MAGTYLAPGVYVEEVPSAQQPIAGVGTNTVGFIGLVPNEIQYPVPNEAYDPQMAAAAAAVAEPDKRQQSISAVEERIRVEEQERKQAQGALDQVNQELGQPEVAEARQRTLNRDKRRLEQQVEQLTADINTRNQQLQELKTPATADDVHIRPYLLEKFDVDGKIKPYVTKLCTNFSEYMRYFGPFSADDPTTPGKALYPEHRALTHAVKGFFDNGGTRCFVARIDPDKRDIVPALEAFESIDAVSIIAAPGFTDKADWAELVKHCDICEDRFAILDSPEAVGEDDLNIKLLGYDEPNNVLPDRNKNAAFYFPWIEVVDPAKRLQDLDPARGVESKYRGRTYVPPSGHVAGIYARTDEERGVHKAPANTAVRGALNVRYYISKPKQALLNPQGVNCIRNLNGNITVWGARTIGGDKNGEWKYINVRRLFLYLRESIDEGTQWIVFEPNDPALWSKIRRNVSAFLTNVWRSGALFGLTPEEAFYVKCDAETNPPEVRDVGMVVTEIGVAIVRPAEFVIFRITQSTGPRTT
jgi:hypothetical protein